jgi:hypothetical protein
LLLQVLVRDSTFLYTCVCSTGADAGLRVLDEVQTSVRLGKFLLCEPLGVERGRGRRVDRVKVSPPQI